MRVIGCLAYLWVSLARTSSSLVSSLDFAIIRSCCFQPKASVENLKQQGKFCMQFFCIFECSQFFKAPCQPSVPPRSLCALQLWLSPRTPFLENLMHLMSEQHILMTKCILSYVGLLLFLHIGPNSTAEF